VLLLSVASAHGAQIVHGHDKKEVGGDVKATTPTPPAKATAATRTLDAIRIEGEIDVPQVLFITARDYRRFREGAPSKYQITSADIAKSIPLPNRCARSRRSSRERQGGRA
jgi:hypothetical protein